MSDNIISRCLLPDCYERGEKKFRGYCRYHDPAVSPAMRDGIADGNYGEVFKRGEKRVGKYFNPSEDPQHTAFINEITILKILDHYGVKTLHPKGFVTVGTVKPRKDCTNKTGMIELDNAGESIISDEMISTLWSGYDIYKNVYDLIWDVCMSLYLMHSLGIVHRDIKFDNILYNNKKKEFTLIDFGISRFVPNKVDYPEDEVLGNLIYKGISYDIDNTQKYGNIKEDHDQLVWKSNAHMPYHDMSQLGFLVLRLMGIDEYDNNGRDYIDTLEDQLERSGSDETTTLYRILLSLVGSDWRKIPSALDVLKQLKGKEFKRFDKSVDIPPPPVLKLRHTMYLGDSLKYKYISNFVNLIQLCQDVFERFIDAATINYDEISCTPQLIPVHTADIDLYKHYRITCYTMVVMFITLKDSGDDTVDYIKQYIDFATKDEILKYGIDCEYASEARLLIMETLNFKLFEML